MPWSAVSRPYAAALAWPLATAQPLHHAALRGEHDWTQARTALLLRLVSLSIRTQVIGGHAEPSSRCQLFRWMAPELARTPVPSDVEIGKVLVCQRETSECQVGGGGPS